MTRTSSAPGKSGRRATFRHPLTVNVARGADFGRRATFVPPLALAHRTAVPGPGAYHHTDARAVDLQPRDGGVPRRGRAAGAPARARDRAGAPGPPAPPPAPARLHARAPLGAQRPAV